MNNLDRIWFLSSSLASLGRRNFQWDLKGSDFDLLKSIQSIKRPKELYTTLYHNIQNQINCQMIASIMDYEGLLLNPSHPRYSYSILFLTKSDWLLRGKEQEGALCKCMLRRLIKVSQLRLELMELMSKLRWPRFWSIWVLVIMMKREK